MSRRSVVLVGPMGSGKSSVGRALGARLGLRHLDTDEVVESRTGRSISDIFSADGEATFRQLEREALQSVLEGDAVVSTGGGIVVSEANQALLASSPALVVWLDATIDTLERRVGSGRGRPLLEGDIRSALQEKVRERAPGYLAVADVRVDTSEMRHADCVDSIVAAIDGVSA